jgi:hypothetical protein
MPALTVGSRVEGYRPAAGPFRGTVTRIAPDLLGGYLVTVKPDTGGRPFTVADVQVAAVPQGNES